MQNERKVVTLRNKVLFKLNFTMTITHDQLNDLREIRALMERSSRFIGLFCLAMLLDGSVAYLAPASLVFYGLALVNGSKYTLQDVYYLGLVEITLGIIAMFLLRFGLEFWVIGFGFLHIIYGVVMYYKYEK